MRRGLWIGLGALLAVAALGIFGLYRVATIYWDFGGAAGELPAAVAEYRAKGLPFVASDLFPTPVPKGENAVPAIRAAIAALPKNTNDLAKAQREPEENADATLARYTKPLALAAAARNRERVDFGRDWDLGPNVLFPEYAGLKSLAKAAALRAARLARKGDDDDALRDLSLVRRLGFWVGGEPTLIGLLVRLAIEAIALNAAERCLVTAVKAPARIARYEAWLRDAPAPPSFGDALRGEMFLGVATVRNLDLLGGVDAFGRLPDGDGVEPPPLDPARLRRSGVPEGTKERAFLMRHLRYWTRAFDETDGLKASPEKIGAQLDRSYKALEEKKGLSYVLLRILVPVFSQAGTAVVNLSAKRAVEAGFAEALGVHARTGRWPASVSGVDPFTGGPLHVRSGKNFRVWSVGRDRKDDGGILRREAPKKSGATFDEVAAYPPVPR